ncbi:hypothetical protein GQR58_018430 [Nymphon striatum]|nr:hypothetical protein GQR58_018430 [Nymphon striatum]
MHRDQSVDSSEVLLDLFSLNCVTVTYCDWSSPLKIPYSPVILEFNLPLIATEVFLLQCISIWCPEQHTKKFNPDFNPEALEVSLPSDSHVGNIDTTRSVYVDEACTLFDELMVGTTTAHEASTAPVVMDIKLKLKQVMENMRDSRTAKLWMMYMEMIDILKMFIKAERTGNWK